MLVSDDPETRYSSIAYKFRLHGSLFLSDVPGEREAIWTRLSDLYDLRSRLVHGARYPSGDEIENGCRDARTLSRDTLRRCIERGFPDAREFRRLAIGA